MIEKINLKQILFAGLILRLLAVFFSRGYIFHDDHFEVIELTWKWRDGIPFTWNGGVVHLFSLIYPGIHYLLFGLCNALGIDDPQNIMIVVRLFHALVSLLSIYYAYRITFRLTNQRSVANGVSLIFAVFWIFPFLSVHSLREFFCIPFLLAGTYYTIAADRPTLKQIALAALFFDLAFCIRLQTVFIPLGIGLYWLFRKGYLKTALLFGAGMILFFFLTQGLFDLLYYGNPFASTMEYLHYNSDPQHIKGYPQGPWYQYLGTLAIISLGFPVIVLIIGYVRSVKLSPLFTMIFLSSLLFFIFHSYYSNKQERFIFPFVPYFLILGITGFWDYYQKHKQVKWLVMTNRFIIGWFLLFNTVGLFVLVFTYSKRARVESMSYLRKKGGADFIMLQGDNASPPPLFYLHQHIYWVMLGTSDQTEKGNDSSSVSRPGYVILVGNNDIERRLFELKGAFPNLEHETDIEPGFIDNLAYRLNPKHNKNETWHIYRIINDGRIDPSLIDNPPDPPKH